MTGSSPGSAQRGSKVSQVDEAAGEFFCGATKHYLAGCFILATERKLKVVWKRLLWRYYEPQGVRKNNTPGMGVSVTTTERDADMIRQVRTEEQHPVAKEHVTLVLPPVALVWCIAEPAPALSQAFWHAHLSRQSDIWKLRPHHLSAKVMLSIEFVVSSFEFTAAEVCGVPTAGEKPARS